MKVTIENYICNEDNLLDLNHFLIICTTVQNENELKNTLQNLKEDGCFEYLEENGIRYGFGNNHFWMSERQFKDEWKRIIFIDFTEVG